ncbi:MAG: hypothetical protein KIT84_01730 [Labilithrix sp.]|nr:hypothetical protein [Labilithrix sp.]MCW5809707.1 hypothetical protein [Labilithrix sp.]
MVGRSVRALVVAAIVSAASIARADPSLDAAELATARALFEEGVAREDAKDWKGALERFKRVAEIRVTPQVLYNMALCYERLGMTSSADVHYARVEKGNAPDLAKLATARRKELASKIPEVVLEGAGDLRVTLDGSPATLGVAVAIDPGPHEIVAQRGKDSARTTFEAPAASGKITIAVPEPAAPPPPAPPLPPPPPAKTFPVLAYVTGGLAVASAGVGVFGVLSRASAIDDLDAACGPARDRCPSSLRGTADRAETMSLVANISFTAAIAAALATAGIVYFGYVRD